MDPNEIWLSDGSGENPPLSNEMIQVAEEILSVKLPEEYIALLRVRNGGYTNGYQYPMTEPTTWSDDHIPFDEIFGIAADPDDSTVTNILDSPYLIEEWGLPSKQVLLSGDGHWWISLDYRKGEIPTISWFDTEFDQEIHVADSFAELINGLQLTDDLDL